MQKLLDSKVMRERLDELQDELVPLSADEKRKKKKKAEPAATELEVDNGDAVASEPNPYAHWAAASDDDDDDSDGGGARLNGNDARDDDDDDDDDDEDDDDDDEEEGVEEDYDDGELAWEGDADADGSVPFGVVEPEEDGSGMFLSSLSAAASGSRAPPRVSRDVFATVDVHAAASTQIGGKKRKNRPGQMARQKKAALKHGAEVRSPTALYCTPLHSTPRNSQPGNLLAHHHCVCACTHTHAQCLAHMYTHARTHTQHTHTHTHTRRAHTRTQCFGSVQTHHTTDSERPSMVQGHKHLNTDATRLHCSQLARRSGKACTRPGKGCHGTARRAAEKEVQKGKRERKERS
jgi:hypothetical protein